METPTRPDKSITPIKAIATVYNGGAGGPENPFAGALYPSRDGKKVIFWDNCDADYSLPHYQWLNKTRVSHAPEHHRGPARSWRAIRAS